MHGAAGGIGTIALQYAKHVGCEVFAVADSLRHLWNWCALAIQYAKYMGLDVFAATGSSDKFSICHAYGDGFCVDHTSTNFVQSVCEKARFGGVDFVLNYGASDLERNIECCRTWGKVVIVDLHGPVHGRIDLSKLQKKQVEVEGYDLRFRNLVYKASVIAVVITHLWPAVLQKKVVPVIEHRFPVIEAQKTSSLLKKNDSIGKRLFWK